MKYNSFITRTSKTRKRLKQALYMVKMVHYLNCMDTLALFTKYKRRVTIDKRKTSPNFNGIYNKKFYRSPFVSKHYSHYSLTFLHINCLLNCSNLFVLSDRISTFMETFQKRKYKCIHSGL